MNDELRERFEVWLVDNGYEDAVASAPRDGGDWGVSVDTVYDLTDGFIESLDEEFIDDLGGEETVRKMMEDYADEAGPYWKP